MKYSPNIAAGWLMLVLCMSTQVALAGDASSRMALGAGPRLGDVAVVEVRVPDSESLQVLIDKGFDISNVSDGVAEVHATVGELAILDEMGYRYSRVEAAIPEPVDLREGKQVVVYHDYAAMKSLLESYAATYPSICRLVSIGQSVQGRELLVMEISDNPGVQEDEPEFKYISTIHGDEPIGTEMCLYLIERLLDDYATDARIRDLVNGTAISIMPLMNPDGREASSRFNAQGIDLNRDFPVYSVDYTGSLSDGGPLHDDGRAVETVQVMQWTAENRFVLSANFHGGELVVNYPFDDDGLLSGTDSPTPDDLLFENVSLRYSIHNVPMWNNPDPRFTNGTVNGAVWYVAQGTLQDWSYRYAGCNDVTIELHQVKWPSAAALPGLWADNEESMLAYLEAVHIGVRGLITDSVTGLPVSAKVVVDGNAQPVLTDSDVGDYHRMLLPGTIRCVSRRQVMCRAQ